MNKSDERVGPFNEMPRRRLERQSLGTVDQPHSIKLVDTPPCWTLPLVKVETTLDHDMLLLMLCF